ncbi:hypothetical protein FACS189427_05350 [Planctomycetales bacterium]|nr:hypothetical protein FACS189427_05350 [Planctomycetales bacterium]
MKHLFPFFVLFCFTATLNAAPTGSGIPFDGQTGYTAADFKTGSTSLSVAAWVKVKNPADSQIFSTLGTSSKDFSLYLYQNNVRMLIENAPMNDAAPGGSYNFTLAPAPETGEWTHYLGTYDGKTVTVYQNGIKKGSKPAPLKRLDFSLPLFIGTAPEAGRVLNGALEDIQIWNRSLTADEAKNVFDGGNIANGLIAAWNSTGKQETGIVNTVAGGAKLVSYKPVASPFSGKTVELLNQKDDGYRGIWYHNQASKDEYKFKYSGGLGTYPANHYPFAVYAPEVDKTFFCYGGTEKGTEQTLLHEISYYDHKTGTVPKPTILLDKKTDDAHDNPVMNIDKDGYIWVFSTSHGTGRPSFIHKSKKPYDVSEFERIGPTKIQDGKEIPLDNFSYFQVYYSKNTGFTALFTTYDKRILNDPKSVSARTLCSMYSADGVKWSQWLPYAGILQGHYQSTGQYKGKKDGDGKIGSSFNFHPNDKESGRVGLNWRSNLYYMETKDGGKTWQNAQGENIEVPLLTIDNKALVHNYYDENVNVYIFDVNFDAKGNPVIVYLTSKGYESGPKNDPRQWYTAYWTGKDWQIAPVTTSDNNYDFGSLYIEDDNVWRIIGTDGKGPQEYNTGSEVAMYVSTDSGKTWKKERQLTQNSGLNHCYPRRPVNANPDFYALWATGHGRQKSESTLYFCNKKGDVFELPRQMEDETAKPRLVR